MTAPRTDSPPARGRPLQQRRSAPARGLVGWAQHSVSVANRARDPRVSLRRLRAVARYACAQLWPATPVEVAIQVVSEREITRLNEQFVRHAGPTDVITFSYGDSPAAVCGEVFTCPAVAATQARRFRAPLRSELARYVIHGLLHLRGYDDEDPAQRRRMKARENALLKRALARRTPEFSAERRGEHGSGRAPQTRTWPGRDSPRP